MDSLSGLSTLRFRLKSLLILVSLVAIACAAPAIWKNIQFQRFKTYLDRDLQSLDESECSHFNSIARSVLNRNSDENLLAWGHTPWFLWEHPNGNLVFLEAQNIFMIPGQSSARVTILNKNGNLINETEFATGWRIAVVNAERVDANNSGQFLFAINSAPVINGRDVTKQYYAIHDEHLILLRLEDSDGNVLKNGTENHMIGPELPERIDAESIEMLKSKLAVTLANAG